MDKKSTPSNHTSLTEQALDRNAVKEAPRRSTLEFLHQFARCYHYEPRLSTTLGSMIMN
ncbi:MAG: hypothetical protein NC127_07210 [Muribaculum sp.]|nr:hypothetical protein [Muribaculum sp.]